MQDTDCEGESYILQAAARKDLIIRDLEEESRDEDGDLEEFGKYIFFSFKWIDSNDAFQITKLVVSSACVELVAKNLSLDKRNKEL